MGPPRLWTTGHSNRTTEELLALLAEHRIEVLVDVRRYPGSRRHPHFARSELAQSLEAAGVAYRHEPDLGGMREPLEGSVNRAIREPGFRGYADHMASDAWRAALARVLELARERTVTVMCAEADPGRCHRRMISDAAVARGFEVAHALAPGAVTRHVLDPLARVADGVLTYPAAQGELFGG